MPGSSPNPSSNGDPSGTSAKRNVEPWLRGTRQGMPSITRAVLHAFDLARHLQVDPEQALRKANTKFRTRFERMETYAEGIALNAQSADGLEALWDRAKQEERR